VSKESYLRSCRLLGLDLIHTSESLKAIFASVTKDGYETPPTIPSRRRSVISVTSHNRLDGALCLSQTRCCAVHCWCFWHSHRDGVHHRLALQFDTGWTGSCVRPSPLRIPSGGS
jgi:hypothetical protein